MLIAMPAHDHCVYLLMDRAGEVIYVGSSSVLFARLGQHAKTKDWWSSVHGISVESFSAVDAMLDRETELIELLDPIHNDLLGTAGALAMASALLGRKITREDVRAYVLADLAVASLPDVEPRSEAVPQDGVSLKDYATARGQDLAWLRRQVERRPEAPQPVRVGANKTRLYAWEALDAFTLQRLREPVSETE